MLILLARQIALDSPYLLCSVRLKGIALSRPNSCARHSSILVRGRFIDPAARYGPNTPLRDELLTQTELDLKDLRVNSYKATRLPDPSPLEEDGSGKMAP